MSWAACACSVFMNPQLKLAGSTLPSGSCGLQHAAFNAVQECKNARSKVPYRCYASTQTEVWLQKDLLRKSIEVRCLLWSSKHVLKWPQISVKPPTAGTRMVCLWEGLSTHGTTVSNSSLASTHWRSEGRPPQTAWNLGACVKDASWLRRLSDHACNSLSSDVLLMMLENIKS